MDRYLRPREHLFSNVPVFHSTRDLLQMTAVVRMIEAASRLPGYRQAALTWAPGDIARFDPGPRGVFMGNDFRLTSEGPRHIPLALRRRQPYRDPLRTAALPSQARHGFMITAHNWPGADAALARQ